MTFSQRVDKASSVSTISSRFATISNTLVTALDRAKMLAIRARRVADSRVIFGVKIALLRWTSSASQLFREHNCKYTGLKYCLLYIIDGSLILIYNTVYRRVAKQNSRCCHLRQQASWFVVTDCPGCIVFVSDVYEGKLDDTSVLKKTHF